MRKRDVLMVIDEVMNNREIDSIRNAILAIRDKVKDLPDDETVKIPLRGKNPLCEVSPYFEGAAYVCVDVDEKIDTGVYGAIWYE